MRKIVYFVIGCALAFSAGIIYPKDVPVYYTLLHSALLIAAGYIVGYINGRGA
jgi:hypothetical protein